MPFPSRCFSAFFLTVTAAAQTFVVDAANGPGTNFTSLAAAAAAVPDGAVLLVRPGSYASPVQINGKSLTVLADPAVVLDGAFNASWSLVIENLAAGQSVYVHRLRMTSSVNTQTGIRCTNCVGSVRIDDVVPASTNVGPCNLQVTNCAAVFLRDCGFVGASSVASSEVVMVRCRIPHPSGFFPQNGLAQTGGSVQLVDSIVRGTASPFGGGPAVVMAGGSLRVLGATTLEGGSTFLTPTGLAIAGTGAVRADRSVVFTGASPPIAPTIALTTLAMPRLTVADAVPPGTVSVELQQPLGHAGFVLVALPTAPFALPFFADTVWMDPAVMFVLAAGVIASGAPVAGTLSMPAVSTVPGFAVAWQGLTFDGLAGLQISNPEFSVVR